MRTLALVWCFASAAFAQSNGRTFHFANNPGTVGMQEILTTLRTVVNISKVAADAQAATITADGTPEQMQAVEWVIHQLDQPPFNASARPANQTATFDGDVYVTYFLKYANGPVEIQEILTALRTVAETQRVYNYDAPAVIALRGSPSQMAMANWMLQRLDVLRSNPPAASQEYRNPDVADNLVRVFDLPVTVTKTGLQPIVTAIRTTGQIRRVYPNFAARAIILRDTADRVEVATAHHRRLGQTVG